MSTWSPKNFFFCFYSARLTTVDLPPGFPFFCPVLDLVFACWKILEALNWGLNTTFILLSGLESINPKNVFSILHPYYIYTTKFTLKFKINYSEEPAYGKYRIDTRVGYCFWQHLPQISQLQYLLALNMFKSMTFYISKTRGKMWEKRKRVFYCGAAAIPHC